VGTDEPPVMPSSGKTVMTVLGLGLAAGALYALLKK
jgi:hypothetical protein